MPDLIGYLIKRKLSAHALIVLLQGALYIYESKFVHKIGSYVDKHYQIRWFLHGNRVMVDKI